MKMIKSLTVAALAALSLSACQSLPSNSTDLTERTTPVGYNTVVFTDYNLSRSWTGGLFGDDKRYRLSVTKHGQRASATGTTEVYVVLRNHTDFDYPVEARTHFVDSDEVPTDADAVWKRMTVPANSVATYRELSISAAPLKYRVEVRGMQ